MASGQISSDRAAYAAGPVGDAGERERGSGWVTFAAVMILIVAALNIIYGIAAISNSRFYVADARFILSDLNTYGWVVLVIGVIELFVGLGILARNAFARWTGVAIVSINLIAQLVWISASPLAALAFIAIDVLVIYGLVVHGHKTAAY